MSLEESQKGLGVTAFRRKSLFPRISINSQDVFEVSLAALGLPGAQRGASVLMYHCFHSTVNSRWTVTPRAFERQLQWLCAHNYRIARLHDVTMAHLGMTQDRLAQTVAISVDDGDISVYTEMFPIIRRYGAPVTLFVYPSAISTPGFVTWNELDEMSASGLVDIQSHSLTHPSFRHERLNRTPEAFRALLDEELAQSRAIIAERFGSGDILAWPHGFHDAEMEEAAARAGYVAAFGVKQKRGNKNNRFAIPRVNIAERHQDNRLGARLALSPQLSAHRAFGGARPQ